MEQAKIQPTKQARGIEIKTSDGHKFSESFSTNLNAVSADSAQLRAEVLHQVQSFINRQSDETLKAVFQKHKEQQQQQSAFKVGDAVEGLYKNGKWYSAVIDKRNENGTYTLNWTDGDAADRIKAGKDIRRREGGGVKNQTSVAVERDLLPKENLKAALEEVGFKVLDSDVEAIFDGMDVDGDTALDFSEFKIAVTRPSKVLKDVERWTCSMPFQQLVAAGFVQLADHGHKAPVLRKKDQSAENTHNQKDPLRVISKCSDEEFNVVCDAVLEGCRKLLVKHHSELKIAYEALDKKKLGQSSEEDQSKFSLNTMSCGDISAFYEGLGGRVGELLQINYWLKSVFYADLKRQGFRT